MVVLSIENIKREWERFLRNSDVFTVAQRGVTTTTLTGTWSAASSQLISRSNGKNIRSITVDGSPLTYINDYVYDNNYDDSGTIKIKIDLVVPQTGDYIITYDYGSDKIYRDFPRTDLTISSFPRMAFDIIGIPSVAGGFGGVNLNTINITTVVYAPKTKDLDGYIDALRLAIFNAKLSFVYVGKYLRIFSTGPILKSQRQQGKDKIFQQNIDVTGEFNIEK